MQKKSGISLIVLIITIVVIIILAGAVIISLANTDIVENANKAKYLSEVTTYKESLNMYHYDEKLKNYDTYDPTKINASGADMKKYIKEMQEKDYGKFEIKEGELVYVGENDKENDWSSGIIKNGNLYFQISAKVEKSTLNTNVEIFGNKVNKEKDTDKIFTITLTEEENESRNKIEIVDTTGNVEKNKASVKFLNLEDGKVYIISAKVKIGDKEYETNENEKIHIRFKLDINAPKIIINSNNKISVLPLKINVKLDDELGSGIYDKGCRYILDTNNIDYLYDNNIWKNANVFHNISDKNGVKNIDLSFDNLIEGKTYYLHVLACDNSNNMATAISDGIFYEKIIVPEPVPDISNLQIKLSTYELARQIKVSFEGKISNISSLEYTLPGEKNYYVYNNNAFTVNNNGIIKVIGRNNGKIVASKEFRITNIDNVPPDISMLNIFSEDGKGITKFSQSAKITIAGKTPDMYKLEYTLPGENTYYEYTNPFVINRNGIIKIRAIDVLGNVSSDNIKRLNVTAIDNLRPGIPRVVTTSNNMPTNKDVVITLTSIDQSSNSLSCKSGILRYEWNDGSNWKSTSLVTDNKGVGCITFNTVMNKEIMFRAIDNAGNISNIAKSKVIIDRTAPSISNIKFTLSSGTSYTNISPSVTITGYPNEAKYKQYRMDNGNWINYTGPFVVEKNCTIYARAEDAAGNEASTSGYKITTIDKIKPVITDVIYKTGLDFIKITDVLANDNVKVVSYEYQLNNNNSVRIVKNNYSFDWLTQGTNYTVSVTVHDAAGNSYKSSMTIKTKVPLLPPPNTYVDENRTYDGLEPTYYNPIIPKGFKPIDVPDFEEDYAAHNRPYDYSEKPSYYNPMIPAGFRPVDVKN